MDTFIENLNNNPIFQLSLSSKELFHSNFLAWLAEDKNTRGLFNHLMKVWMKDSEWEYIPQNMEVKREYNHFDFCVCEKYSINDKTVTGNVKVVLENKFKSIAYKAQLQKYEGRTRTLNEEGYKNKFKAENTEGHSKKNLPKNWKEQVEQNSTKYILLTLAEDFLDKDFIKTELGWTIVTYADYSKTLRENIGLISDCFYRKIIERYCDFIDTFSTHINSCMNNINIKDNWDFLDNAEFKAVRCNDVWQKLVMHKCALELSKMLEEDGCETSTVSSDKEIWEQQDTPEENKLFIMVNYFHGEGMLELKYILPEKGIFTLQQQGIHPLRAGILDMNNKHPKYPKGKKYISKWNKYVKDFIDDTCLLGNIIHPKKDINEEEKALYNSYGIFYYNDLNDHIKNIGDTLKDMIETIKTVRNKT